MPRVASALARVSTGTANGCVTKSRAMSTPSVTRERSTRATLRAPVIAAIFAVSGALSGASGCGGKRHVGPAGPGAVATVFPAARWVPGRPTYVFAAPTMRDAQHSFGEVVATVGMAVGIEELSLSGELTRILGVDPQSDTALAEIGVDLDGSVAMFSDDIDPTFVVHLSSPTALGAFLDGRRQTGLVTQSVMVDGDEVFSATVDADLRIEWTVDKDWLWVHVAGPHDIGTQWFTASKHPADTAWVPRWQAAQQLAQKAAGLVGFVDLHDLLARGATHATSLAACARRFEEVRGVSVVVEGEGNSVAGTLAIDLGPAAGALAQHVLAPPPGWAAASAKAPLSVQWNLDLQAVAAWAQPCMLGGLDLAALVEPYGVRSGRAFVYTLDPDDKSGTGAVAIDLAHRKFFAQLLDQIPMRSKFERGRQFGAYNGKHLSVPFVATADYVLDDHVFLAAMGDGMLERAASGSPAQSPPVFAIDLVPPGMPAATWAWLAEQAQLPVPKRVAQRLQEWADLHLGAHLDHDALVIEARGNRR